VWFTLVGWLLVGLVDWFGWFGLLWLVWLVGWFVLFGW
jgi:hypothetical protein